MLRPLHIYIYLIHVHVSVYIYGYVYTYVYIHTCIYVHIYVVVRCVFWPPPPPHGMPPCTTMTTTGERGWFTGAEAGGEEGGPPERNHICEHTHRCLGSILCSKLGGAKTASCSELSGRRAGLARGSWQQMSCSCSRYRGWSWVPLKRTPT